MPYLHLHLLKMQMSHYQSITLEEEAITLEQWIDDDYNFQTRSKVMNLMNTKSIWSLLTIQTTDFAEKLNLKTHVEKEASKAAKGIDIVHHRHDSPVSPIEATQLQG